MGYPPNFKIVTKSLTENILLASTAFQESINSIYAARMAVFKFPQSKIKSFYGHHYLIHHK